MTDEVVDALAVFRLTRLAVSDTFPPVLHARWRLLQQWPEGDWRTELATCSWCLSFWIAVGVLLARRSRAWRLILGPALAASAVAGFLADRS